MIPLSLYIHIPWCIRKCPYCDFNSHQSPEELPESRYIDALLSDLHQEMSAVRGRPFSSIFIGGGTPSLFSATSIERLIEGVNEINPLADAIEVTLEANPGTFEQQRFTDYRKAGINRLSIGIQSYNSIHLKKLGRIHNASEAINAATIAREAGFDNFNLDLMFGLPDQTIDQALSDLRQAIHCSPAHLSWYQLTLEPNTLFHHQQPVLPEHDTLWAMQNAGQALLEQQQYKQYEVSAYAHPQRECLHNRNYWEFGDYIGIGAGAHGKLTLENGDIHRYQKFRQPKQYMEKAQAGVFRTGTCILESEALPFEFMLNALRLKAGVPTELFQERTGLAWSKIEPMISNAERSNMLHQQDGSLLCTEQGWRFLDDTLSLFL